MSVTSLSRETKDALETARKTAAQLGHDQLDVLHVFYALITATDVGLNWCAEVAGSKRADVTNRIKVEVAACYEPASGYAEPTPTYITLVRLAQDLADQSDSDDVGILHLIAAVIQLDDRVRDVLAEFGCAARPFPLVSATPLLDRIGRDLTALALQGKLGPVIGRDAELQQMLEILLRRGKNNVLVVGEPGTGKTTLVKKLALYLADSKAPEKLRWLRLIEVTTASLVAGTTYRGEFEERLLRLLDEVKAARNVILVIDEFHTIVSAGTTRESALDASNILKPALARGEIRCIGVTTFDEYRQFVEQDEALARRFEKVIVSESTQQETITILQEIVPLAAQHHRLLIAPGVTDLIVSLTGRYMPARRFPDKAIDLLSRAASRAELQGQSVLDEALIQELISEATGIPVGALASELRAELAGLEDHLGRRIIGQDAAIQLVAQSVRVAYAGLRDPELPRGVFLFAGPSGVGKTQLAHDLARLLFGSNDALVRLDMSEYGERYNVSRLIGAAPGLVGFDEPGQLTQPLRERGACVVLFDEVEKAHPDVFDLFLQLFDSGRITDSHGNVADGRNAFFIMTTNLGASSVGTPSGLRFGSANYAPAQDYLGPIREFFRPEFLNRIDRIVQFRSLDDDDIVQIVELELRNLEERLRGKRIRLSYEPAVVEVIGHDASLRDAGARGVRRSVEDFVAVPLAEFVIRSVSSEQNWLHMRAESGRVVLEWV